MARASKRDLAEIRSGKASARDRAEAGLPKFPKTRGKKKKKRGFGGKVSE